MTHAAYILNFVDVFGSNLVGVAQLTEYMQTWKKIGLT